MDSHRSVAPTDSLYPARPGVDRIPLTIVTTSTVSLFEPKTTRGISWNSKLSSYGHAGDYIERLVLWDKLETHRSYNEYLFRMEGLDGKIGGERIQKETVGHGFGPLEYA